MAVEAIINGVRVTGLTVMTSRYKGYDPCAKESFPEGTQIAFKHKDSLTAEEKAAIFPNGVVYNLTIQWPLKGAKPASLVERLADQIPAKAYQPPVVSQADKTALSSLKPSSFQETIRDRTLNAQRHIFIEALAGTGKTTTLVWLVYQLMERGLTRGRQIIYLAFNKSIQLELDAKLTAIGMPRGTAQTTHAFGYSQLKRKFGQNLQLDDRRNYKLLEKCICDKYHFDYSEDGFRNARKTYEYEQRSVILEMVGYIKNWAIFPVNGRFSQEQMDTMLSFIDIYNMEWEMQSQYHKDAPLFTDQMVVEWACRITANSIPGPGETLNEIAYDDMLYLPLCLNLPLPKFDLILTDESQDFNSCQLLLLERLSKTGARIVVVGDKFQSLYRFRGADCRAFDRIGEMLKVTPRQIETCELPVNYRCDQEIINHARQWVPKLQGANKAVGTVGEISFADAIERANPKTDIELPDGIEGALRSLPVEKNGKKAEAVSFAFLCRINLPIIVTAYKLIGKGKKIAIIGRKEFGGPMRDLVIRLCGDPTKPNHKMRGGTPTNRLSDLKNEAGEVIEQGFLSRLGSYFTMQAAKLTGDEHKKKLEDLLQNKECLEVIAERVAEDTVVGMLREIDSLFSDDPQPGDIVLSTVHRAKGLEWDVVFLLRPDLLPHPLAKPNPDGSWSDEQQQEQNAQYVATTRARHRLYYVNNWPFGPRPLIDYQRPVSPFETAAVSQTPVPVAPPASFSHQMAALLAAPAPMERQDLEDFFVDDGEPF